MPYNNRESGQYCFVKMNCGCDVEPPARQTIPHNHFGPKHDTSAGHDEHSPDQGPVFSFLRVIEAGEFGFLRSEAEIVGEILPRSPDIIQCGEEISRQLPACARDRDIEQVIKADGNENYGRNAMQ